MVDIMLALHKYVPSVEVAKSTYQTFIGDIEVPEFKVWKILFRGDQLTAARSRGARKCRGNLFAWPLRLDGLIPCAEDWHV